ncbi:hypothetical protein GCM10018771_67500 [Streptomyces cellulosae]|nr:hypothetical protein GCM10018771_67500 [Streptomyces cellulosae]
MGVDTAGDPGFSWTQTPVLRYWLGASAMYDTFQVRVHPAKSGSCWVTVAGELDVMSAPGVRDTLRVAIADYRSVVVDCSGVTFCDCSGLSALLAAVRAAQANGIELRLRAVPHSLARLLRLTHTGSAFTIEQPDVR